MTQDVKVQIVRRDKKSITVRDSEGKEHRISGEKVSLVYCTEHDLDDAINGKPNPQTSVEFTMAPSGCVLCFGMANVI